MNRLKRNIKALGTLLYGMFTMALDIIIVYSAAVLMLIIALLGLPIAIAVGTTILIHKTIKEIK